MVPLTYKLQHHTCSNLPTSPTPHNDSPAVFRLETVIDLPKLKLEALVAITNLSEQEDRNSGFELKQETVAVTVFPK